MRPVLAVLGAVLLSACAAPATPEESPEPVRPTVAPVGDGVALDAECAGPAGLTVAYPESWSVNSGDVAAPCSRFAPEPFDVRPHSDVRLAEIVLGVRDVALESLAVPPPDEAVRTDVVVDGRPAVRQVLVTGPGLYPQGTEITRYLVDLGDGRTLVADTIARPGTESAATVEVLDAMMDELEIGGRTAR